MKEIPFSSFTKLIKETYIVLDVREQEEYDALQFRLVRLSLSELADRYQELEKRSSLLCHLQVWSTDQHVLLLGRARL